LWTGTLGFGAVLHSGDKTIAVVLRKGCRKAVAYGEVVRLAASTVSRCLDGVHKAVPKRLLLPTCEDIVVASSLVESVTLPNQGSSR